MIMAEALASDDIALILPSRRFAVAQHGGQIAQRLGQIAARLGLDGHHDAEKAHFGGGHGFVHLLEALLQRDADLEAFDQAW